MVGTLPGVDSYFRSGASGGIESTFGVGGPWEGSQYDGVIYQWRDTQEQADANLHANGFAVSIETSDGGDPNHPWSAKQVDSLVRLGRWLADTHNIPKRITPTWDGSGFGWHVMFGAPGPWTPVSKTCPGSVRIKQLKEVVLPRIFAAGDSTTGDEWMALFDSVAEFQSAVRAVVQDEIAKSGVKGIYPALARGEINGVIDTSSTHYDDSNRGLHRHIGNNYAALARGEINGVIDPTSQHYMDSHRHLADELEEIKALLNPA
jgi:hypothetical protein